MSHFDTDGQEKKPFEFSSDVLDAVTMPGEEQWSLNFKKNVCRTIPVYSQAD